MKENIESIDNASLKAKVVELQDKLDIAEDKLELIQDYCGVDIDEVFEDL